MSVEHRCHGCVTDGRERAGRSTLRPRSGRRMTPADDLDIGFTGARFGGAPRKRRRKKGEEPAEASDTVRSARPERRTADEADTAAIPVVAEAPAAVADPAPGRGELTGF